MTLDPNIAAVLFGLLSAATWGTGDFSAGLATRRAALQGVVVVSQTFGLLSFLLLALLWREPFPPIGDLLWGGAAGLSGTIGLAALYRSLADGKMGLAAPLIAVLGALFPVLFGIATEGAPGSFTAAGFAVALVAVWLISRPDEADRSRAGLGLAVISGLGIGGFLILIDRVSEGAVFWPLAAARVASVSTVAVGTTLVTGKIPRAARAVLPLVALAGIFDALGNTFFLLASQSGRLDVATVLSSLYPVSTVLLARAVLDERLSPWQTTGIVLGIAAILLIAL